MKLSLPQNFWSFTAGNVITVVLTVVSVAFGVGRVNGKIDGLISWQQSVEQRINHMDEVGTKALVTRNQVDDLRNVEQDRRISNLETTVQQLVPDVREIKTKLDLVAKYLEEARPRNKGASQ